VTTRIEGEQLDNVLRTLAEHRWVGWKPELSVEQVYELCTLLQPLLSADDVRVADAHAEGYRKGVLVEHDARNGDLDRVRDDLLPLVPEDARESLSTAPYSVVASVVYGQAVLAQWLLAEARFLLRCMAKRSSGFRKLYFDECRDARRLEQERDSAAQSALRLAVRALQERDEARAVPSSRDTKTPVDWAGQTPHWVEAYVDEDTIRGRLICADPPNCTTTQDDDRTGYQKMCNLGVWFHECGLDDLLHWPAGRQDVVGRFPVVATFSISGEPNLVPPDLSAAAPVGQDTPAEPEWCQAQIWPSWAPFWVKCGSAIVWSAKRGRRECGQYGHVPEGPAAVAGGGS